MKIVTKADGKKFLRMSKSELSVLRKKAQDMMKVNLPQKWIQHLSHLPESGMGYQQVDVTFKDGSILRDCSVLNGEVINIPDSLQGKAIIDIKLHK